MTMTRSAMIIPVVLGAWAPALFALAACAGRVQRPGDRAESFDAMSEPASDAMASDMTSASSESEGADAHVPPMDAGAPDATADGPEDGNDPSRIYDGAAALPHRCFCEFIDANSGGPCAPDGVSCLLPCSSPQCVCVDAQWSCISTAACGR